jgi:hypothetical protein
MTFKFTTYTIPDIFAATQIETGLSLYFFLEFLSCIFFFGCGRQEMYLIMKKKREKMLIYITKKHIPSLHLFNCGHFLQENISSELCML